MTKGKFKNLKGALIVLAALLYVPLIQSMSLTALAFDPDQVVRLNNDGVNALNAGNFPLAIQRFNEALKVDPNYKLAKDNLAITYNNYGLQLRNNPKEALKQFHQSLFLNRNNATTRQNLDGIVRIMGRNPGDFKDRVELGDQARLSGDFTGAIIEYSEALRLKDDAKIHVKLGEVYRVCDQIDNAIEEFRAAARLSDSADVQLKLGQAYQAKNDISNAIQAYGKAIEMKPDDPDVLDGLVAGWDAALKIDALAPANHIGLGQAFQYRGDFGQAEQEYKMAIRLARGNEPIAQRLLDALPAVKRQAQTSKHINAGVDLQSRKLFDQAIAEYKLALQADHDNAKVWVNIGSAYQQKDDYDNALDAYQQALKIEPGNSAAQQGIKTASAAKQDKMIAEATKAGSDYFKQGKYDEAIKQYELLLKSNPQDAAIYFNLGATYQGKKDIEQAIAKYRQAIAIDQTNKIYKKALDDALAIKVAPIIEQAIEKHKAKDYAAAIAGYQEALKIQPKNANLLYDLASAQYSREDYASAKQSYQKAFEVGGKDKLDGLYLMAVIDEHLSRGTDARQEYQKYIAEAPTGRYVSQAKERYAALSKDLTQTIKIKTEAELAKLNEAEDSYKQAVKLQGEKRFDQAMPLYQKAVDIAPKNVDYNFAFGTLFQQKGDMDKALVWYQKAKEIDPRNKEIEKAIETAAKLKVEPMVDQAVAKQTAGDIASAIALYKQALDITPKFAKAWTNLGTAYQQSDQFADARDAYQKGYDYDRKSEVGNLYLIALIDENFEQGRKALGEYQEYLRQAPTGQYAALAKERARVLQGNPSNVQRLATTSDIKALQEATDAFEEAVKLQQSGKVDEAISLYQKALQIKPKESAYAYQLGTAYQAKGDIDSAIDWYQKAMSNAPANQLNDFQKVLAATKDLKATPIMEEAVKKHQANDFAGAIELYQKALRIIPGNAHGYTNMASAYQSMDNFPKAREYYQKALELDKRGETDNWYFIGLLDEHANNGRLALEDYQKYIAASPRGTYAKEAQQRISELRLNPGKVQKIVTATEQKRSGEAQAAYEAAVKLQEASKLDEAIAEYKKAISFAPNEASFYGSLGTAYQAKNDLDQALENYKKAASMNPKEPTYKTWIKQLLPAKAAPFVQSAIDKQTTKNDPKGAIADYESALKIDNAATTHMNLGTAYQQIDNYQKAITEYTAALTMDPTNTKEAYYYLGTVYEALNQPKRALQEYENYLKKNPGGTNINEVKGRIKELSNGKR